MIMKIMTYAKTRQEAIDKMRSILGEVVLEGLTTNLDFQYSILENENFIKGNIDTDFIENEFGMENT